MGFFDLKVKCAACDKEVGLNRYQIDKNVWLCPNCFKQAGGVQNFIKMKNMTIEQIKELVLTNKQKLENFNATKKVGSYFYIDEVNKQWVIPKGAISGRIKNATIYNYSDIISFELLEDGSSVATGGTGKALAGGILFGGVGALVGGVTGKKKIKNTCSLLQIKITVDNSDKAVEYINLINVETKKDGIVYKSAYSMAQEILSILEKIYNSSADKSKNNTEISSIADEILKFKNLLDSGVITQEEFEKKKNELLKS